MNKESETSKPLPRVNGVYQSLLKDIVTGAIPPGEFLSEEALAERFQISRTPLREAFIHLYKEGLLQKGPFKGYVVSEISLESVREIFQLRLVLEPAATKLAAQNPHGSSSVVQAETTLDLMKAFVRQEKLNGSELLELGDQDSRFHLFIAEASGNKRMTKFISELQNQIRRFPFASYNDAGVLAETFKEHSNILEAVKSGHAVEAEQNMLHHIQQAMTRAKGLIWY